MARSFNQVTLLGNTTKDIELKTTPRGQSVANISLALNRSYKGSDGDWQEATDFVDVVAWGALAERLDKWVTRGQQILVSGRLQSRSWEQDGQKRSKLEVLALDVIFTSNKQDAEKKVFEQKDNDEVVEPDDSPINLNDIPF